MLTCTHACVHALACFHVLACACVLACMCTCACMHAGLHAYMLAGLHACMRACAYACIPSFHALFLSHLRLGLHGFCSCICRPSRLSLVVLAVQKHNRIEVRHALFGPALASVAMVSMLGVSHQGVSCRTVCAVCFLSDCLFNLSAWRSACLSSMPACITSCLGRSVCQACLRFDLV